MSVRRKVGDRVFVGHGAAFGASGPTGTWATIMAGNASAEDGTDLGPWNDVDEEGYSDDRCMLFHLEWEGHCKDEDCGEWANLETDDGHYLYHVSECQMFDGPPP
jgi:hypothetical protein